MMKRAMIFFSAGCIGAMANSAVAWWLGDIGIPKMAGVSMAPALTPGWLYPRIVWGGMWGLLFLLPMLRSRPVMKGFVISLFPTAAQLLYFFPNHAHKGMAGLALGLLTPVFVLFYNWIWGVVTAVSARLAR